MRYLYWLYARDSADGQNTPRLRRLAFRYPPPVGDITVQVRSNHGADAFVFGEVFEHRYYDLPLTRAPGTILDLGANVGFASLFLGRKYPQAEIACVEPVDSNFRLLCANLALNHINAAVFEAAAGISDGFMEMTLDAFDYGHKIVGIDFGKTIAGRLIRVESLSVPTLLQRLKWARVELLKIDIEGYEGVLLAQNRDWLWNVDQICIECHENYGESDLIAVARDFGFSSPRKASGLWLLERSQPARQQRDPGFSRRFDKT